MKDSRMQFSLCLSCMQLKHKSALKFVLVKMKNGGCLSCRQFKHKSTCRFKQPTMHSTICVILAAQAQRNRISLNANAEHFLCERRLTQAIQRPTCIQPHVDPFSRCSNGLHTLFWRDRRSAMVLLPVLSSGTLLSLAKQIQALMTLYARTWK